MSLFLIFICFSLYECVNTAGTRSTVAILFVMSTASAIVNCFFLSWVVSVPKVDLSLFLTFICFSLYECVNTAGTLRTVAIVFVMSAVSAIVTCFTRFFLSWVVSVPKVDLSLFLIYIYFSLYECVNTAGTRSTVAILFVM